MVDIQTFSSRSIGLNDRDFQECDDRTWDFQMVQSSGVARDSVTTGTIDGAAYFLSDVIKVSGCETIVVQANFKPQHTGSFGLRGSIDGVKFTPLSSSIWSTNTYKAVSGSTIEGISAAAGTYLLTLDKPSFDFKVEWIPAGSSAGNLNVFVRKVKRSI